jgi:hypothetical protein
MKLLLFFLTLLKIDSFSKIYVFKNKIENVLEGCDERWDTQQYKVNITEIEKININKYKYDLLKNLQNGCILKKLHYVKEYESNLNSKLLGNLLSGLKSEFEEFL